MKKTLLVICVISFIVITPTHSYADEKIGFYDMREVMMKSDAGKKASGEFKILFEKERTKIQEAERDLHILKDYLEKNRSYTLETEYQERFRKYQKLINDSNEELQKMDKAYAQKITPQILVVVERIKNQEKYTAIQEKRVQGISSLLNIFSKDEDITNKVIFEFNRFERVEP